MEGSGWWDEECDMKKREMRRRDRSLRDGGCEREAYLRCREELKKLIKKRKEVLIKDEAKKMSKVRKEADIW